MVEYYISLLIVPVHPWSHNWPTDISDADLNSLKMYAFVASGGSCLMWSCASCLLLMVFPFGSAT